MSMVAAVDPSAAPVRELETFLAGAAPEADDAIVRLAVWVRPKLGLS